MLRMLRHSIGSLKLTLVGSLAKDNSLLFSFLNTLLYMYRRQCWILDISRFFRSFDQIIIDRPIFLLGVQGGGLTVISRMLRRNKNVVSVTGNHHYWSGADEMQNVLGPILPPSLTGIKHKAPIDSLFPPPRSWTYAIDRVLPKYRKTADDFDLEIKRKFEKILRWTIYRSADGNSVNRFIDKSQVYTVKLSFINALLKEYHPYFILITRNPYAACYRAAMRSELMRTKYPLPFEERLALAGQHWANSIESAVIDGRECQSFEIIRMEDIVRSPEPELRKLCDFIGIGFSQEMLPAKGQEIPLGTRNPSKWYPLRSRVNSKYLSGIRQGQVEIIAERCGEYADLFGYERPLG